MRIGVDVDDTIVNSYNAFLYIVCNKYNLDYVNLLKGNKSYSEFFEMAYNLGIDKKELFTTMANIVTLKDGVVDVLNKLVKDGYKIIFITARNLSEYDDPYQITIDYLKKYNIPYEELHVNVLDKGVFCNNNRIDLFIDDSPVNVSSVNEYGIKTIQFDNVFSLKVENVLHASNWNEVYEIINTKV